MHRKAAVKEAAPARDGGGVVELLAWAHFLNDGAANYLPGILPALLAVLALPLRDAGLLVGILIAFQALQPLAGVLADRGGTRRMITAGLAGSSLGAACIGWSRTPATLVGALVLIGICNTLFHPPALAGVRRLASRGEQATAVFLVGGEIGRGAWPLLAGVVVTAWGLRSLWVLTLAALPTLPLLWMKVQPLPRQPVTHGAWHGVRTAGRPLAVVIVYSALRATFITGVSAFVPLLWEARGGHLVAGAGLITTMLIAGIIGNLGADSLARRWGRKPVVVVSSIASCAMLAAFLLVRGPWLWVTLALLGIAVFTSLPLTVLMGQDLLPRQHSLGSGLALGFSNALGAGLVAVLGLLAPVWGPAGVLWTFVGCGLVALALSFSLPEHAVTRNPSNS